jgi:Transposase DDE domain
MLVAYELARQSLPSYSCKFSRHDFTLPQLFACLVVKEQMKRSYRGAEALLRDCDHWLKDIGLARAPDHNTLCRAAGFLLRNCHVSKLLDRVAQWAAVGRILGLSTDPLAIDATTYESHHVSRHYERRCHQTRQRRRAKDAKRGRKTTRADTVKALPKLAIGVATHCHLALSAWTGTGGGGDHPHFEPVLFGAWRRVPHRRFTAVLDAGYDGERYHELARRDMGLRSVIPPAIGRPRADGGPPGGRWRRHMARLLRTKASRRRCGYNRRYQVETVNSMMKRNLGSALGGRTPRSRQRDMLLKVLTHDVMVLRTRVETEQVITDY